MADKPDYKLLQGNIADYIGGAIVVPCWTNLSTANAISSAINKKLEDIGVDTNSFWTKPSDIRDASKKVPLYSAHFYEAPQLPDVDAYILATCYVDKGEQGASFSEKAAKTTANALRVANKHNIKSIAFPTLMTGHIGGSMEEILPAMIKEFKKHIRSRQNPSEIKLYVFDYEAYLNAVQISNKSYKKTK